MFCIYHRKTTTLAAYSINWLVFITEMKSVYCAVRDGPLNKAVCAVNVFQLNSNRFIAAYCIALIKIRLIFRYSFCLHHQVFRFLWHCGPTRAMTSSFLRFLDHTQRRITVGRTPLDEWSARHRDLYLTTHNIHNRQISIPPVGFEPTISAGERPQTYALDRAATGSGLHHQVKVQNCPFNSCGYICV